MIDLKVRKLKYINMTLDHYRIHNSNLNKDILVIIKII